MEEENKNSDTARKFLNLWQKQLEHIASDPETASELFKSMQLMQQQYFSIFNQNESNPFNAIFPNIPASNSALSQYGDDEFLELKRRLRICEERIAELESCTSK